MQRLGSEAIRTQIEPSKPKREMIKIINSIVQREHMDNRVSSYFPKGGHIATQIEQENNMNTRMVKRHRYSNTKNRQQ